MSCRRPDSGVPALSLVQLQNLQAKCLQQAALPAFALQQVALQAVALQTFALPCSNVPCPAVLTTAMWQHLSTDAIAASNSATYGSARYPLLSHEQSATCFSVKGLQHGLDKIQDSP